MSFGLKIDIYELYTDIKSDRKINCCPVNIPPLYEQCENARTCPIQPRFGPTTVYTILI